MPDRLDTRTLVTYAIGSVGTAGFATLPGLVLIYYLTDMLGVSTVVAGLIVAVAKIWDILIDPVIGAASDHDATRTGSRRRFMVSGAVALPVFFALTFAVPADLPTAVTAVWVAIAFLLAASAFSVFQVPYIALPAELTDGYDERTRLLTARVVVLTIGILAFGAGGPALREVGQSKTVGYLVMGIVAGLVIGLSLLIASTSAPRGTPGAATGKVFDAASASYRDAVAALRRSRPLRLLLGAFILQGLATGLMLAGGQYIAKWVLHNESAVSTLFAALIAPALLCAPLWGILARRIGKREGFLIATGLFAAATTALIALTWSSGAWVYAVIGIAGAAYAGMQALPMAMLPDVISHDEDTHGRSAAGVMGGVWTGGETSGMALGAVVLTGLLAAGGYISSQADTTVTQPDSAITAMIIGFSVLPAALALIRVALILRYPLDRSDIDVRTHP